MCMYRENIVVFSIIHGFIPWELWNASLADKGEGLL